MTGLGPRAVVWFIAVLLLRVACETTECVLFMYRMISLSNADSVHVWL
jgi:hypothetical protein